MGVFRLQYFMSSTTAVQWAFKSIYNSFIDVYGFRYRIVTKKCVIGCRMLTFDITWSFMIQHVILGLKLFLTKIYFNKIVRVLDKVALVKYFHLIIVANINI